METLRRGCLLKFLLACAVLFVLAALAGRDVGSAPGCWSPEWGDLRDGSSYRGVLSGARERCYLAFVPPALYRARPVPIVFSLHGFAANPDGQRANARWEVLAAEQGFLVVYPQGSSFPLRWNVGPQARLDSVDDVRLMLRHPGRSVGVADDRPGARVRQRLLQGGHMTHLLACALADRIAAVGIVEGLGGRLGEAQRVPPAGTHRAPHRRHHAAALHQLRAGCRGNTGLDPQHGACLAGRAFAALPGGIDGGDRCHSPALGILRAASFAAGRVRHEGLRGRAMCAFTRSWRGGSQTCPCASGRMGHPDKQPVRTANPLVPSGTCLCPREIA